MDIDFSQELYPVRKPLKLRQIGCVAMALWRVMAAANPGGAEDWREYPEEERLRYRMLVRLVLLMVGTDGTLVRSIPHRNPRYCVTEGVVKQSLLDQNLYEARNFSLN